MDPNNNQQQGVPSQQAVPQPQNSVPVPPVVDQQMTQYQNPNANKGGKTTLLLVVLLIVVIAMTSYLFFLSTNSNYLQSAPVTIRNVPTSPVSTPTPTLIPETDSLDLEDPEKDIKDLETSALEL